jgi:predicted secreted protein
MVELPCPEVLFEGLQRKTQTKEEYDKPRFRCLCKRIAQTTTTLIREYQCNGIKVLAVLGIKGSPSCGVEDPSGILIDELKKELTKKKIGVPFHELNLKAMAADIGWLKRIIET